MEVLRDFPSARPPLEYLLELLGAQFTGFTGTKVQTLTQKALLLWSS